MPRASSTGSIALPLPFGLKGAGSNEAGRNAEATRIGMVGCSERRICSHDETVSRGARSKALLSQVSHDLDYQIVYQFYSEPTEISHLVFERLQLQGANS
jgi:hypothetical protein